MSRAFGMALVIAISASVCVQGLAQAGEVKLLSALVMKPALTHLADSFERTSGHKLTIAYDSAGAVTKRIQSGEAADVAIIQKPVIEAFGGQCSREYGAGLSSHRLGDAHPEPLVS